MWKKLKIKSRLKYGDQRYNKRSAVYEPIPLERIGTEIGPEDSPVRRWVRPAGPKYRHGEPTKRLTIRVPESLHALIPSPAGTWAADRVIEALKARGGR